MENVIKIKSYSLNAISKLRVADATAVKQPIAYGLALEKQMEDGSNLVLAFIKYNEHNETTHIEFFTDRIEYIENRDWQVVKSLLLLADEMICTANLDEREDF